MQQLTVQLVLKSGIIVVAYNVHTSASFRDKIVVVSVNEVRNPALANMLFRYIQSKILYYGSCRR
jgi:hypothetical protein